MAKYLVNIDLDNNQLQNAALHPVATAPASPVEGQVYFDTSPGDKEMYFWDGTSWVAMGAQGTVTSVGTGNSTFINLADSGTATDPVLTASLSATGTPDSTKFLRGDNSWAVPAYYTNSDVDAHLNTGTATSNQILSWTGTDYDWIDNQVGDITAVNAGTYLNGGGTSGDVTLNHDNTSRTDTTSSASPAAGGTFTAVDSVTSNATGHITAINLKTVTLPADTNTTSLPVKNSAGTTQFTSTDVTGIRFAGTGSTTVSFTAGSQLVTIDSGNETITLTGEVTGSGTTSISTTVANNVLDINNFTAATIVTEAEGIANNDNDTTLPTSAAVKDYVDTAIVGGLVYQGGYNAATNTPDLDVSPSASIKKGWTYTVTADGSFFTEQVRVGDVLIAEIDAPTTLADWTTVQNNIDLASASQVGIGNVAPGEGIDVSYSNGTATVSGEDSSASNKGIVIVAAGTGISVSYASGTATVANTDTNSANTATGTITAGNTSGSVSHSFGINTMVQTIDSSGNTVYCDIARTSTSVTASIAAAQAGNITILVQKIG